ncbi:MAG TPA: MFS transporter [Candidatus Binatia bacterium]|jgi:NNP family nitrate/nitrite transporter-like MFS transporter
MQLEDTSKPVQKKSSPDRVESNSPSFRAQLRPVFFLVVIFLLNFTSRIILSPLLPTIEKELAISHSQAGFFFFLTSGGYLVGLLSSGWLASRTSHSLAIVVSSAGVGIAMVMIAFAANLWLIRFGLLGVGLAAGWYMPSAIATITSLVDRDHWGKAIAVHELAPNLAFFISPFIAELFLKWASWRSALAVLGVLSVLASVSFGRFGRGGDFPGESPLSSAFGALARTPAFWLMIILFGLGVSSTVGIYAMLPLYLVTERAFEPSWANTILAFSRSHGPVLGLLGGWATDKLGAGRTIIISMAFTGVTTLLLGLLSDRWLSAAVLFQPLLAVWFFPAAFAAISMITPPSARNLAVSFSVPFGFLIGGGTIPTFIGAMGDAGSFATGFAITGALIGAGALLALLLRLPDDKK